MTDEEFYRREADLLAEQVRLRDILEGQHLDRLEVALERIEAGARALRHELEDMAGLVRQAVVQ